MSLSDELYVSGADKAYEIIYSAITSGELPPGTKLSRRKMAEMTEVSVIPVIEALKRLESDGLVESKPRWGSYVTVPTKERLDNQYILREAIECKVVQILTERGLTAEQEDFLRRLARETDGGVSAEERPKRHHEFHNTLADYTGYSSFQDVLNRINLFFILCRAMSTRRRKSEIPPDWHERIVDAIQSGDSSHAQEVMKLHIYDSYNVILEEINNYSIGGPPDRSN